MGNKKKIKWPLVELKNLTSLVTNGFVGTATTHYSDDANSVLYIQGYNVKENSFNFNGIKRVTREFHIKNKKSELQDGDLLTIQTGDVGLTTIVPKSLEGANCHALIITRFKKEIAYPKFYSYYFNSHIGRSQLKVIETGSTMKHINVGDIIKWKIPVPSIAEQKKISSILSTWDIAIETLEQLIAKKERYKKALMQRLLTGKVRFKVLKEKKWKQMLFGDAFEFVPTIALSREQLTTDLNDNSVYNIHYGDIHATYKKEILNFETEKSIPIIKGEIVVKTECLLQNGDLIIADASEDYDGVASNIEIINLNDRRVTGGLHTFVARDKSGDTVEGFRTFILKNPAVSMRIKQIATGSKVYGISKNNLSGIEIILPSLPEQRKIASILLNAENDIELLKYQKLKVEKQKKGLMQQLLTGKISNIV